MPNTVTAVRFKPGTKFARAAGAAMSTAGATSIDTLVVLHTLGKSPTHVTVVPRSVVAGASGANIMPVAVSWNQTQVNLQLPSSGASAAVQVDVLCEIEHSLVS